MQQVENRAQLILLASLSFVLSILVGCNTASAKHDDNMIEFYNKAWEAYYNKEYKEAIPLFQKIDKQQYPDVLFGLGNSYMMLDSIDNALANFLTFYDLKFIDENSSNYNIMLNKIGICYADKGDSVNARSFFEKAKLAGNEYSENNIKLLESK